MYVSHSKDLTAATQSDRGRLASTVTGSIAPQHSAGFCNG
jgi:hypothetical protein